MKKYPIILLLTRRGGEISYDDVSEAIACDSVLAEFFQPGETLAVLVANSRENLPGWASAFTIIYGSIQPTPSVYVVGLGFNNLGLGAPGDMDAFIHCFPEMEYEGVNDVDIEHTSYGVRTINVISEADFETVLARYPLPDLVPGEPTPYLAENRTLH